jgi:hypothetical protein
MRRKRDEMKRLKTSRIKPTHNKPPNPPTPKDEDKPAATNKKTVRRKGNLSHRDRKRSLSVRGGRIPANNSRKKPKSQYISKIYKPLNKWEGCLNRTYPVFILGNGPSLCENDLSVLDGYFTIGINRILQSSYTPTVVFWQDVSVTRDIQTAAMSSTAIKVAKQGCCQVEKDDFLYFKLASAGYKGQQFPSKCVPDILYGHGNTINICSQFAISLNPSHIILLGVDCKYEGDKTNFYGVNNRHSKNTMRNCCKALEKVKKGCKIPIYNCGLNEFWQNKKLEDVLPEFEGVRESNDYFKNILKI